jgi:hypothetical protein
MAILDDDLKIYRSAIVANDGTNGGPMSNNQAISGQVNNVWPNVFKAERIAGVIHHRKVFAKNTNADNVTGLTLYNPQIWIDILTPGQDWVTFFPATQVDTQADILGTERHYGCAKVAPTEDVNTNDTAIVVEVEDAALATGPYAIFSDVAPNNKIRITNQAFPGDAGQEEELEVAGITTNYLGNALHIQLALANPVTQNYLASASRVMSIYEPANDVVATYDTFVNNGSGGFDDAANLIVNNVGAIEQDWTITFTSATNFDIVENTVGDLGNFSIASNAPVGPLGSPYFDMEAAGFTGTFNAGETITFSTHPAAVPLWERREVPALCDSLNGDQTTLVFTGESA